MSWIEDGLHIDKFGNKNWYKDGKQHRKDGPAAVYPNGLQEWGQNGLLHRIGGPAIEDDLGYTEWRLYGKKYEESDYNHVVSNLPLLYWNRFKEGRWI